MVEICATLIDGKIYENIAYHMEKSSDDCKDYIYYGKTCIVPDEV